MFLVVDCINPAFVMVTPATGNGTENTLLQGPARKKPLPPRAKGHQGKFCLMQRIEIKPIHPLVATNKCRDRCDLVYSTNLLLNNFPQSFKAEVHDKMRLSQIEPLPTQALKPGWWASRQLLPVDAHHGRQALGLRGHAEGLPLACGQETAGEKVQASLGTRGDSAPLASLLPCCAVVCAPTINIFLGLVIRSSGEVN